MLRGASTGVAVAIVVAVAIGAGGGAHAAGKPACSLLTAEDVVAVMSEPVTWSSAKDGGAEDATICIYGTKTTPDYAVHLAIGGGRAEFDSNVHQLQDMGRQYHLPPLTAVSGVGDAAYLNTSGQGFAQIYVVKGETYFTLTVYCKPADCAGQSAALGRKVAERIGAK